MESWQVDLTCAARDAKIPFASVELVSNEAHARVAIALLRAFGSDPAGYLFAEPRTPDRPADQNARPTDLLIVRPELGAFLVEVKGWVIGEITQVEAGTIFRNVRGYVEARDPWKQAQDAAGQLQKATQRVVARRRLPRSDIPFFDWVVAFPNISRMHWSEKGWNGTLNGCEVLFSEDLIDSQALRERLVAYIRSKIAHKIPFSVDQLNHVRAALGSSVILTQRMRKASSTPQEKLGWKIEALENKDKRLSGEQRDLIEAEFDGRPQLIRGVAGSGKSIVLVKNLANMLDRKLNLKQLSLDLQAPPRRFAIVCFNRSLVPFLKRRFEESFRELTYRDPPDCMDINYVNGLQFALSNHPKNPRKGPLTYLLHSNNRDPAHAADFAEKYSEQLDRLKKTDEEAFSQLQYDAIYVDEGQDLFEQEYLFLMRLLRTDEETGAKNIVIFYDDAQNLYGRPRPNWSRLGIQVAGGRTYVMKTCFRNTKQIIEFAFNVLLGIQADTRVMTKGFADVTYLKEYRLVEELPDRWQVNFAERSDGDFPDVALFETREEERRWVVGKVCHLINQESVRPEDILVVFESDHEFAGLADDICSRSVAVRKVIKPYGRSDNREKDSYIFEEGALTMGTVNSVKGYDCPVVFLVGSDSFPANAKEGRVAFYVAATRAKLHLFVTGLRVPGSLAEEAESVSKLLASPVRKQSGVATNISKEIEVTPKITAPASVEVRLFRRGDVVRHPSYGIGPVLEDAIPKPLPSQGMVDQSVRVQFEQGMKTVVAGLAGIELIQARERSEDM